MVHLRCSEKCVVTHQHLLASSCSFHTQVFIGALQLPHLQPNARKVRLEQSDQISEETPQAKLTPLCKAPGKALNGLMSLKMMWIRQHDALIVTRPNLIEYLWEDRRVWQHKTYKTQRYTCAVHYNRTYCKQNLIGESEVFGLFTVSLFYFY